MAIEITEIQPTPNPNAMKYLLDHAVTDQPTSFFNRDAAKDHPLARQLFEIDGVTSLLLLGDFITVNKRPDSRWPEINAKVKQTLAQS